MDRPIIFSASMVKALLEEYDAGATLAEMAKAHAVSRPTVAKALRAGGAKMRPAAPRRDKMAGANNPAWKGGRRVRLDGYVMVQTENGERLEHRVLMEDHIGRPLLGSEIVHHKDGNRQNNEIVNLAVMSQSEHVAEHKDQMSVALKRRRGDQNPHAKLTDEQVKMVRGSALSGRKLAVSLNVAPSTVHSIRNGSSWRDQ